MIVVKNGGTLTSVAAEEEVCFVEADPDGKLKPLGRTKITFVVLSGAVKTAVGISVDANATSRGTAGTIFSHTCASSDKSGGSENLRVKGVATVDCYW